MPIADSFGGLQAAHLSEIDAAYRHYLALVGAQEASRRTSLAERAQAFEIPRYFQQRADILSERAQDRAARADELDYTRTFNAGRLAQDRELADKEFQLRRETITGGKADKVAAESENLFHNLAQQINKGEFDTLDALKAGGGANPRITQEQFGNLRTLLGQRQLRMRQNFEADAEGVASDLTEAFKASPEYKAAAGDPAQLKTQFSQYYRKLKPNQLRYVRPAFDNQSFEPRRDIAELPSDALAYAPGYRATPAEPEIAAPFRLAAMVQAAGRSPVGVAPTPTAMLPVAAPAPAPASIQTPVPSGASMPLSPGRQAARDVSGYLAPEVGQGRPGQGFFSAVGNTIAPPAVDSAAYFGIAPGPPPYPRRQFGPPVEPAPTPAPQLVARAPSPAPAAPGFRNEDEARAAGFQNGETVRMWIPAEGRYRSVRLR